MASKTAATKRLSVPGIALQTAPPVYLTALSGSWLLRHTTPSWRIDDPEKGFQRIVKQERAKQIARTVLDRGRPFPSAITLATNVQDFRRDGNDLIIPSRIKLLVVDGQHRLWAQKFSKRDGSYACVIHLGKTEVEMAELFLEINDNQHRVPSSLRWDLYRLVRPAGDKSLVMASDLVYFLSTRQDSPFYFALDLTGEKKDVSIKQGSLAPEIKTLVSRSRKSVDPTFDDYLTLLLRFFTAVRSLDPDGWGDTDSTFYKARVLRALTRILADLLLEHRSIDALTAEVMREKLLRIDKDTLSPDRVRLAQGSAGVSDLHAEMRKQVFG
jgi:DGQHR domain-containing protein